ncbi:hypothetical protein [Parabacteroides distasonis]|uniref:hypothetical protein n=1 Tax=Parabacteroides distasonis TaxID=823 RepID=UPI002164384C|nr:hypothetical protein [Parabacteroides distasonis]UVR95664.1 hypothetical protein NXX79_20080 [Parabacteroides distasonis]
MMTLGLSLFLASVDTFAVIETGCKGIKKFHDAICKVRVFYRFLWVSLAVSSGGIRGFV